MLLYAVVVSVLSARYLGAVDRVSRPPWPVLVVVEKGGQIAVLTNLANPNRLVFLDLKPRELMTGGESGELTSTHDR